jgi:signal transduction histidine kinase
LDQDASFAGLVSLACHDLRTPLATVHGFARTLADRPEVVDPIGRYLGMIDTASVQLGELIDRLGLAARIVAGRYDPDLRETDSLELAQAAAARLADGRAAAAGQGTRVLLDRDVVEQALADLALAAVRHGGLDRVDLTVRGVEIAIAPVDGSVGAILLGINLRDLGAGVAGLVVDALGGSIEADGERVLVRLPST